MAGPRRGRWMALPTLAIVLIKNSFRAHKLIFCEDTSLAGIGRYREILKKREQFLERIHRTLLDAGPLSYVPSFRYTVSIGITALRADDSVQSVFSRADQACYEAKRQGRNRSVRS